MQKWEYMMECTNIQRIDKNRSPYFCPDYLWDKNYCNSNGQTVFDKIQAYGAEGWELVNVTSVDVAYLLFSFRRPVSD